MKKIARWIFFVALISFVLASTYYIVEKNRPVTLDSETPGRQIYIH